MTSSVGAQGGWEEESWAAALERWPALHSWMILAERGCCGWLGSTAGALAGPWRGRWRCLRGRSRRWFTSSVLDSVSLVTEADL